MFGGASTLQILRCPSCSAPLALGDSESTRCAHCGTTCPIPETYRALRKQTEASRSARRLAEGIWRTFPAPLPAACRRFAALGVVAVAILVPTLMAVFALGGAAFSIREWVVGGLLVPTAIALYPVLEVLAYQAPFERLVEGLSAKLDEREQLSCRLCSAPLCLEADAIAATCDYCGCDSLLSQPRRSRSGRLAQERLDAVRSLEQALLSVRVRRVQRLVLRIGWFGVWGAVLLLFWLTLPR